MPRTPALRIALLAALACPGLAAQETGREADWPARVRADIEAADRWVQDVYPGYVDPDASDLPQRWRAAVDEALARAARVDDVGGWQAVMRALVLSLRDGHVGLWLAEAAPEVQWGGIALERRGERFVARRPPDAEARGFDPRVPDGAELLGCDGEAAAVALPRRLDGWVADWQILAQRSEHASALFVDRDNPFVPRLQRCAFSIDGESREIPIDWKAVGAEQLESALQPYRRIKAAQPVELRFGDAGEAWIVVGTLSDPAALGALRQTLERERERILAAPFRVFDLRGNGGGDSRLGDALIEALWGADALLQGEPAAPKRWRASPRVLARVERLRDHWRSEAGANPNLLRMAEDLMQRLPDAIASDQALLVDGPLPSAVAPAAAGSRLLRERHPSFVLTDGGCFSSCIMLNQRLKRAGAIHVGDPSGRHTMYGEGWFSQTLPSGLASLGLPIAINAYPRGELGGEPTEHAWTGAADDEAGLRAWIATLAAAALKTPASAAGAGEPQR